jgi:putative intracellular protease/amidase
MFQNRPKDFDPRVSAIADHFRAIEKELGAISQGAGRRAAAGASAAGNQIADAISPILNEIIDRFARGGRLGVDEAANFGNEAVKIGRRVGNDALNRIATQTKNRPLVTLAVAMGVGILIGMASRRS